MWTNTRESKELTREITKDIINDIAPEELRFVDDLIDDYYSDPIIHKSNDNPLGFGSDLLVASTPIIIMTLNTVFNFILNEVWVSTQKESAVLIASKMKALFNPTKKTGADLQLTSKHLSIVKQLIKREAIRGGMKSQKAEDLALKIVGRISLDN